MFTNDELVIIKDLFEEKTLSKEEEKVLDKIKLFIEFDNLETEYSEKRNDISNRLNKINEK